MRIGETGGLEHFLPDGARYTRRQDVPVAYRRDGSVYVVRTDALVTSGSLYGRRCAPLVLRPDETLTIDGPLDWAEAEQRLAERLASS
jgi:CMP-N-acetylneuraminic acid synthetase